MEQLIMPGGIYADALPSGEYVVGYTDHIATRQTHLALPPGEDLALFVRLTATPRFKCAFKAHTSNTTWEWDGRWWGRPAGHGVQSHGYRADGTLDLMPAAAGQDSQGLRYFDPSAPAHLANEDVTHTTPGWVTGSPTYHSSSALAAFYGVKNLYEWTHYDGIVVGQGAEGGCVVQLDGVQRLLLEGEARFVQFHRDGERVSVAVTRFGQHDVVLFWLTVGEVRALPPIAVLPPVIPPVPEPPVPAKATIESYQTPVGVGQPARAVAKVTEGEPDRFIWQYEVRGVWFTAADNGADDLDHHYRFAQPGEYPIRLQTVTADVVTDTTGLRRVITVR